MGADKSQIYDYYIVKTGVKLIKFFSFANGTWCAVTVPSYDFVKDDCAVGSAVLGKRGIVSVVHSQWCSFM